jgi:hypothetical protein
MGAADGSRRISLRRRPGFATGSPANAAVPVGNKIEQNPTREYAKRWPASNQARRDRVKTGVARTALVLAFAVAVASSVIAVLAACFYPIK